MLDPARAGLTKTGQPSAATDSCAAAGSRCHSASRDHDVRPDRQAGAGQQDLHELLVHRRRRGEDAGPDVGHVGQLEQALQRAVLAERPVQQREDHVDLAERARHLPPAPAR